MTLFHCSSHFKSCNEATRWSASVIKVGVVDVGVHISSHVKEELTCSVDKWLWIISSIMLFKKQ